MLIYMIYISYIYHKYIYISYNIIYIYISRSYSLVFDLVSSLNTAFSYYSISSEQESKIKQKMKIS